MNVTPMIEILLVLIIAFMVVVVVSAFQSKGLEAQIPQPATKADNSPTPRTIVIQLACAAGHDKRPELMVSYPITWPVFLRGVQSAWHS